MVETDGLERSMVRVLDNKTSRYTHAEETSGCLLAAREDGSKTFSLPLVSRQI